MIFYVFFHGGSSSKLAVLATIYNSDVDEESLLATNIVRVAWEEYLAARSNSVKFLEREARAGLTLRPNIPALNWWSLFRRVRGFIE